MSERPNGIIIAIDGPSGAGKSTAARLLAARIGYVQIDTGAMYRAVALLMEQAGIDPADTDLLDDFCRNVDIRFAHDQGRQIVIANGIDVTGLIRTPEISRLTSRISALKPVRDALLVSQRRMGKNGGVVLEGRDIGTVVFPDAELKFYLSASAEERGRRRFEELSAKGVPATLEETVEDVVRRDRHDSERDIAPLRMAADAVLIDSSRISAEQVIDMMQHIFQDTISDKRNV